MYMYIYMSTCTYIYIYTYHLGFIMCTDMYSYTHACITLRLVHRILYSDASRRINVLSVAMDMFWGSELVFDVNASIST